LRTADVGQNTDVSQVPNPEIGPLAGSLVGAGKQRRWHGEIRRCGTHTWNTSDKFGSIRLGQPCSNDRASRTIIQIWHVRMKRMHFWNEKPSRKKRSCQNSILANLLKGQEMKPILGMMTVSAAALSTLAFVAMATPLAQAGEFCATNTSGMRGCGYSSLEQCRASMSGIGASCGRDPYYDNASTALAYQPKQTRSRSALRPAKQSVEH
jgi:hypothetical protein